MEPTQLGRYRVLGELAPGRFGPVWLAHLWPPGIGGWRSYACVKQLDATPPGILDELKRAAAMMHRNACTIFEVAIADGQGRERGYLALEYVLGGLLSELPRDERLVAGVAAQVREGLDAAHACGLVHGALTADDVLVSTEGRAVVLGFGTARFRPDAVPSIEADRLALDTLFGEPRAVPLPEAAIGRLVASACADKIRRERELATRDPTS